MSDGKIDVEIEIDEQTKELLTKALFDNPDKSLNQIVEEALNFMMDKIEEDPDYLDKVLEPK